ncbi:G-protein alpha subunit 1, partial [Globisporangium splendens]
MNRQNSSMDEIEFGFRLTAARDPSAPAQEQALRSCLHCCKSSTAEWTVEGRMRTEWSARPLSKARGKRRSKQSLDAGVVPSCKIRTRRWPGDLEAVYMSGQIQKVGDEKRSRSNDKISVAPFERLSSSVPWTRKLAVSLRRLIGLGGYFGGSVLSEGDKAAYAKSRELDAKNEEAHRAEQEKVKLLLLGAGESGKSTVFKQMKILCGAPLTEEEKRHCTPIIYNNVITSMKILIEQCIELKLKGEVQCVKNLWSDPGIVATWTRRAEFQIVESVKYYFNDIDRIMRDDYSATQQDMLYARVRTSGIVEERYQIGGATFVMYDVGGQRNERKKWIHCFEDVTAVIFVAALSEYDQSLYEDASTNRMIEAITLFDEIINNKFFLNSAVILFLNKKDLFQDKIKKVDPKSVEVFKDFPGGLGDYELGVQYFLGKFMEMNRQPEKEIYHHVTCATDSQNVQVVFNACKDIILKQNIKGSGFM